MLKRKPILPVLFFILFLVYSMSVGCSNSNIFEGLADDSTKEAKLEEAQIALDKGDFTAAISTLLDLCGLSATNPTSGIPTCDNDTISLLASAYMGKAGLDMIKIIDTSINATGQQDTFTEFSTLFLDPSINQGDMHNAVVLLSNIPDTERTQEQNFQMAVAATADTVLIIGDITGGFDQTGLPNNVPSTSDPNTINAASEITQNIGIINKGVTGSGIASEDLTQDITTIQTSISGGNSTVTPNDLTTYLCNFTPKPAGC